MELDATDGLVLGIGDDAKERGTLGMGVVVSLETIVGIVDGLLVVDTAAVGRSVGAYDGSVLGMEVVAPVVGMKECETVGNALGYMEGESVVIFVG